MKKSHFLNESAAFDYIEKNFADKYTYPNNFENKIKLESLKTNIIKRFELQDISDTLQEIYETLWGILRWLILIFILLSIILYKIW